MRGVARRPRCRARAIGGSLSGDALALSLALVLALLTAAVGCDADAPRQGEDVDPIPDWILYPGEILRSTFGAVDLESEECREQLDEGAGGTRAPLLHVPRLRHPFMAAMEGNNMHADAAMSDSYSATGPSGSDMQVRSRTQGFGGYGTVAFDRLGRLVAVFSNARAFQLELMDPHSLAELASFDLPPRPWSFPLGGVMPWEYIGAGMYFYLDEQDRAVVPTTENAIQVVGVPGPQGESGFTLEREYDLSDHVVPMGWPARDSVAWVLPDWSGRHYWWATTAGMIGSVELDSGAVESLRLAEEQIENSFAVAEEGVFIVSDRALYRFGRDAGGAIVAHWRSEYDRGTQPKPGHITRGSGSSVTLLGAGDGLVAVTDNADSRVHLLFFERGDGSLACSVPLFEEERSGTDISVAGFEHADADGRGRGVYSAIVENNWGHHRFPRAHPEPGFVRVDVTRRADGGYDCGEVWTSGEKGLGVFKLSLGNGLLYSYWRSESCPVTQWYLVAIDFASGKTVYRKRTGSGLGYNNWAGALFLHPGGEVAYSTTIFGLVRVSSSPAH